MKKRKEFYKRALAIFLALSLLNNIVFPTAALALTTGPSQPEVQSFEPVGTSEMVDLFSGDFNYNIPLLDVDGYPVNISYHSGITTDQEATWVGLGWNINPGVINRSMRGLPDDFKGDQIEKEINMKDNITVGVGAGAGSAIAGLENLPGASIHVGAGINYNNYVGIGIEKSINLNFNLSKSGKGPLSGSLGFKSSSSDGLTISPSLSYKTTLQEKAGSDDNVTGKVGIGTSFNSRVGLKTLTLSTSVNQSWNKDKNSGGQGTSGSYSFGAITATPQVTMNMKNISFRFSASVGGTVNLGDATVDGNGYYSQQKLESNREQFPAYGYMYEHEGSQLDKVMLDFNREKDGEFSVNTPGLPLTNHTYDIYSISGQGVSGSYRLHRGDAAYVFDSRGTNTSDSYNLGAEITGGNVVQVGVDVNVSNVNTVSGKWTSDNPLASRIPFKGKDPANPAYEPAYFKQAGEKTANIITSTSIPKTSLTNIVDATFTPNPYATFKKNIPVKAVLEQDSDDDFLYKTTSQLSEAVTSTAAKDYMYVKSSSGASATPINYAKNRDKRTQEISYLTKAESDFMLRGTTDISYYANKDHHVEEISVIQPNGQRYVYGQSLYNTTQKEVTFNASDNNHCTALNSPDAGYISYTPGVDNSLQNRKGIDNYYSSTTIPRYAHSHMLTAVLSSDYVDVDATKGPSPDDFGTYTLFEYQYNFENTGSTTNYYSSTTSSVTPSVYSWRTPYKQNKANYNENMKTRTQDDQGNYVYGQKEVRYLKYIKTKNYVAVFELNNPSVNSDYRQDAWGVADENGGAPSYTASSPNQSRYLKTITLYSRVDFENKCANSSYVATPVKQVHFEYDYSLCDGIENSKSNDGKLTLKKIYFTYGNSNKAKFSAYKFDYADIDLNGGVDANANYNIKAYNRWGNYKPVSTATTSACNYNAPLSNTDFPYVEQDLTQNTLYKVPEDYNAAQWSLTKITLPSGGEIKIDYESDDYGYVQDRNAMQMFKVVGTGANETDFNGANPVSLGGAIVNATTQNIGFFVDLQLGNKYNDPATVINAQNTDIVKIKKNYFRDMTSNAKIYFRTYIKVNSAGNDGYEFVSGYAEVDPESIKTAPNNRLFFKLKPAKLGKLLTTEVNPLSAAAIQFGRLKTPREAFSVGGEPSPNLSPASIIAALLDASFFNTAMQTVAGPEHYLFNMRFLGRNFFPSKTWFRLYNPFHDKMGGGSRVKKILISDKWDTMVSSGTASVYGQSYDYTTTENYNGTMLKVSSGVASYEPMVAGDENPFRQPVYTGTHKEALLAPDNRSYIEEPFGETLFPSPSVGYGKVSVRSISFDASGAVVTNAKRHSTGYVLNEFYTAKDYPVITRRTDLDVAQAKSGLGASLLALDVKHYMYASQGYVIELNDMHGKPKATWVYGEGQTSPLSGVQYFYKDDYTIAPGGDRNHGHHLMNDNIPVIDETGKYYTSNTNVGVDYDFVTDFREEETVTESVGAQLNLYVFYMVIPFAIPPVWPSYSKESVRLRTASITKVINRYGIIDEVVAHDLGAKVATKNLAWDAETGEVLVTQTVNEFDDPIYNFTYPAHWAYKGMEPAYQNNLVEGTGSNSQLLALLTTGDEVIARAPSFTGAKKAWVIEYPSGKYMYTYNPPAGGNPNPTFTAVACSTATYIKVIRSGYRNMQTTPVGAFTSLINPLKKWNGTAWENLVNTDDVPFTTATTNTVSMINYQIINASAVQFDDVAKVECNCYFPDGVPSSALPYYYGFKGNWHPKTSYTFLTPRSQTTATDPNNIGNMRSDGTFTTFKPFWQGTLSATAKLAPTPGTPSATNPYWTFTSGLSIYSVYGNELENRDALNRYSSATFGYNNSKALSVATNAQYKETGFDGFEDYGFDACTQKHRFRFKNTGVTTTTDRSHTGKYSVKVPAGNKATLSKGQNNCIEPPLDPTTAP